MSEKELSHEAKAAIRKYILIIVGTVSTIAGILGVGSMYVIYRGAVNAAESELDKKFNSVIKEKQSEFDAKLVDVRATLQDAQLRTAKAKEDLIVAQAQYNADIAVAQRRLREIEDESKIVKQKLSSIDADLNGIREAIVASLKKEPDKFAELLAKLIERPIQDVRQYIEKVQIVQEFNSKSVRRIEAIFGTDSNSITGVWFSKWGDTRDNDPRSEGQPWLILENGSTIMIMNGSGVNHVFVGYRSGGAYYIWNTIDKAEALQLNSNGKNQSLILAGASANITWKRTTNLR